MKLSTVLLSSAALLVAGAAYAADLPAKKAAPAAAPTGCAAFGAGYIAIPGGDTCLKISGYVAYEGDYAQTANTYGQDGFYRMVVDTSSSSEIGTVHAQGRVDAYSGNANSPEGGSSVAASRAYVDFAGVTAGLKGSLADIAGTSGYWYGSKLGGGTGVGINYTVKLGNDASVTIGEENAIADGTGNSYTPNRPDILAALSGKAGAVSYSLVGISHATADSSTGATGQGYAFVGRVGVSVGNIGAAIYGGSSKGAMKYTSGLPSSSGSYDETAGVYSAGSNFGGELNTTVSGVKVAAAMTQASATPASGSTTNTTYTGLYASIPVAKNLTVQPEFINTAVTGSSSNTLYLFIERDF